MKHRKNESYARRPMFEKRKLNSEKTFRTVKRQSEWSE